MEQPTTTIEQFATHVKPTWCPGCGNFGIWLALKNALAKLGRNRHEVAIVYGVGCHGNMRDWLRVYGVEGLHGRAIPLAQGLKLANPKLTVIAVMGDGDCLGEGGNHFIQAAKRNPDITAIIHDNEVYGLTTGQASPTAQPGFKTKSTPEGVEDVPFNPLALSILAGSTFAARGFAGDMQHLTDLFAAAIAHKGYSVVDVLQPCVTFDKVHTYPWYRERVYKLDAAYNPEDRSGALAKLEEWGGKIPLGVFYRATRRTQEEREPALAAGLPLGDQPVVFDRSAVLPLFR